jgi:hypothetical protein
MLMSTMAHASTLTVASMQLHATTMPMHFVITVHVHIQAVLTLVLATSTRMLRATTDLASFSSTVLAHAAVLSSKMHAETVLNRIQPVQNHSHTRVHSKTGRFQQVYHLLPLKYLVPKAAAAATTVSPVA